MLLHRDGKTRHARHGLLCGGCYGRLERTIAELPAVHTWLQGALQPGTTAGEHVTATREPPTPLRVDVYDERVDIAGKLTEWARLVAEERQLHGPTDSRPESTAAFLLTHLDWSAAQPWVDEYAAEMFELRRDAHTLAPWTPGTHRLPAPCPTCDALTLIRHDGADHVTCDSRAGGCGRSWSETQYRRLVLVLATEAAAS